MTMVQASPAAFKQLGRARVVQGPEAWGPLALAGPRLLVRDLNHLSCLDVSAEK
jgi:outer membrane protein assembly factor BamB